MPTGGKLTSENAQLANLQTSMNMLLKEQLDNILEAKNEQMQTAVKAAEKALKD